MHSGSPGVQASPAAYPQFQDRKVSTRYFYRLSLSGNRGSGQSSCWIFGKSTFRGWKIASWPSRTSMWNNTEVMYFIIRVYERIKYILLSADQVLIYLPNRSIICSNSSYMFKAFQQYDSCTRVMLEFHPSLPGSTASTQSFNLTSTVMHF